MWRGQRCNTANGVSLGSGFGIPREVRIVTRTRPTIVVLASEAYPSIKFDWTCPARAMRKTQPKGGGLKDDPED